MESLRAGFRKVINRRSNPVDQDVINLSDQMPHIWSSARIHPRTTICYSDGWLKLTFLPESSALLRPASRASRHDCGSEQTSGFLVKFEAFPQKLPPPPRQAFDLQAAHVGLLCSSFLLNLHRTPMLKLPAECTLEDWIRMALRALPVQVGPLAGCVVGNAIF